MNSNDDTQSSEWAIVVCLFMSVCSCSCSCHHVLSIMSYSSGVIQKSPFVLQAFFKSWLGLFCPTHRKKRRKRTVVSGWSDFFYICLIKSQKKRSSSLTLFSLFFLFPSIPSHPSSNSTFTFPVINAHSHLIDHTCFFATHIPLLLSPSHSSPHTLHILHTHTHTLSVSLFLTLIRSHLSLIPLSPSEFTL